MKNFRITVNGSTYDVQVEETGEQTAAVAAAPAAPVAATAPAAPAAAPAPAAKKPAAAQGSLQITAPMPGTILSVNVKPGDTVKNGGVMFILEAMKMENEIVAPRDGVVASIHVNKGEAVDSAALLATLQ